MVIGIAEHQNSLASLPTTMFLYRTLIYLKHSRMPKKIAQNFPRRLSKSNLFLNLCDDQYDKEDIIDSMVTFPHRQIWRRPNMSVFPQNIALITQCQCQLDPSMHREHKRETTSWAVSNGFPRPVSVACEVWLISLDFAAFAPVTVKQLASWCLLSQKNWWIPYGCQ